MRANRLHRPASLAAAAAIAATAIALLSPGTARAADTYTVDAAHSEAGFQIRHLVGKVRGRLRDLKGTILIEPGKPEASSVEFTIQAKSIDTGVADRDKHLRSADFFDVEKFPEISFKSTKIVPAGKDRYDVTGSFTMHGVTKVITIPVTLLGIAKDPWGNERAGFEVVMSLNRKDYGIVWNKILDAGGTMLGEEVSIAINLEAVKQKAKPAA